MSGHEDRAHAKLSASGSKRWMNCTPSPQLEEEFEDEQSIFAAEGTLAHEIGEEMLKCALGRIKESTLKRKLSTFRKHELYSNEMPDYLEMYVDCVVERYHEAIARDSTAFVMLEERLDYSEYAPGGFGTGDTVIISDEVLEVIDLKYGKGVKVEAEDNSQMRLYGLGALEAYGFLYDIKKVRMTISQPRLDHIDTEELTVEELLEWAETEVKPKALLADKGEGEFVAGSWCKFCKVRFVCRARAEHNLELAKYDFKKGPMLDPEDIGDILVRAGELSSWATDISSYALKEAEENGAKFPGWKLVAGRSNRKYGDEEEVAKCLQSNGYEYAQIYKPQKLKGITDLTKLLGKKQFNLILGDMLVKPAPKPTLVPLSDKREELNSVESAIKDFE